MSKKRKLSNSCPEEKENYIYILKSSNHTDCYKRAETVDKNIDAYKHQATALKIAIQKNLKEVKQLWDDYEDEYLQKFLKKFNKILKLKSSIEIDNERFKLILGKIRDGDDEKALEEMNTFLVNSIQEEPGEFTERRCGTFWKVDKLKILSD